MMIDKRCPISAVDEALKLAPQIEVHEIPSDFEPGDVRWREILATIARRFSNYSELLEELEAVLDQAQPLADDCEFFAAHPDGTPSEGCSERWLAEHRLWEAALAASEKAYQRWLAKQALRRAAGRVA